MSKLRISLGEAKIEISGYEAFRDEAYDAVQSLKVNSIIIVVLKFSSYASAFA